MSKENKDQNIKSDHSENMEESIKGWSKVSKKKKPITAHLIWFSFAVLAIVIFLILASRSHNKNLSSQAQDGGITPVDYQSDLNINMNHIRAGEKENKNEKIRQVKQSREVPFSKRHSKAYMARQNAPTSMYTGSYAVNHTNSPMRSKKSAGVLFSGQGKNAQFGNSVAGTATVEAKQVIRPDYTIASGEFLHAVLETAINSNLPGMVRAIVSQPVYSYTGERMIIPAGSRLIGQYSSAVVQGQNRVMVVWNRVILPGGTSVQINSPGTDALGRAGQRADSLNTHFFARFGESVLLSLIGAGASTLGVNTNDQYNSAAQYRTAIAQSFQQSAQQSLQGTLPMGPTIRIYQGAKINVFVARDLSFYQALSQSH